MTRKRQAGFTLIETMVSLVVLLAVSAVVTAGITQMMRTQGTIANRTEMHTSVRGATELLEQEIGQAGRISLPPGAPAGGWQMTTAINVPADTPVTPNNVTFNVPGLFDNEQLLVDTGAKQETITLTCPAAGTCTNSWTAGPFYNSHAADVPISAPGAFSTGVVPPLAANAATGYPGYPNGSTDTVLKLYGDINGDGNMVYVEYTCVPGTRDAPGFLYRNQVGITAAAKPALDASRAVLTNVLTNPPAPNGAAVPCFTYQVVTLGVGPSSTNKDSIFVTDVAVTLTEQTQLQDAQTHDFQNETKAMLNVSPRNVFDAWLLDRQDNQNRVQPIPLNVQNNLLPSGH